jgi:hypothetical protein
VLQILMGWENYHLWAFELGKRRFELPDPDGMSLSEDPPGDPERTAVRELLVKKNKALSALPVPRRLH